MNLYTTQEIQHIFEANRKASGVTMDDFIDRCARGVVAEIEKRWRSDVRVYVFAGPYENGAFALASARLLSEKGYTVHVTMLNVEKDPAKEICRRQRDRLLASGFARENFMEVVRSFKMPEFLPGSIVLDGIFGSELNLSLQTGYAMIIRHINDNKLKVVSIDVPSGMTGDWNSRTSPNYVIKARLTVAFQFPHLAFFLPNMSENIGEWVVVDIGFKNNAPRQAPGKYILIGKHEARRFLPKRRNFTSKDDYGSAMIFAGCYGMMGAAIMAARGALRSGVGKLTISSPRCAFPILQSCVPEALYQFAESENFFSKIHVRHGYDAVAVGPGIGTNEATLNALDEYLSTVPSPIILDADALNCIALRPAMLNKIPNLSIITPHAKEFDRLFGEQSNGDARVQKAIEMARQYNIIIVLKGHYTIVARPDGMLTFNSSGTPAMATPGSGDVLTGIITSFYAQLKSPVLAAVAGVFVHGLAGEIAEKENGSYGVVASDIADATGKAIQEILQK